MAKRKGNGYDWEAIEREYGLGQKSLRILSKEFGPSFGTIGRRAKKYGWVQDKSAEVRKKTAAALIRDTEEGHTKGHTPTHEDIDRAVKSNIAIIRGHRKGIKKGMDLVELLSGQLNDVAGNREVLIELIIEATKGETDGKPNLKQRNAMMKAVALPTHSGVLRDLSMALKNLIPLERQAFGLDEPGANPGDDDITVIPIVSVSPPDREEDE